MSASENHPASRRIISVTEEELNRIVLDVHDGPVQNLFAALSLLAKVQHDIETKAPDSSSLLPTVKQTAELIEASLREIKSFLGTFRSPEFHRRSLKAVVESLVVQHEEWTGQEVELEINELPKKVALPVKISVYRILQEALSNTHRHAQVEQLWVTLGMEDGLICLLVDDQGQGFEPPPLTGPEATEREEHIGLRGMRERVELLGGIFELTSSPGSGTHIKVKVPAYV
jgi:signal transduction histidine kinase